MLSVVTDHSAPEEKSMAPQPAPQTLDSLRGHSFGGQAKRITYCGAKEQPRKSAFQFLLRCGRIHFYSEVRRISRVCFDRRAEPTRSAARGHQRFSFL